MDIELLWLILYIISILIMLGCGKSRKESALISMSIILIIVTGWGLFVGYPATYATNNIFAVFTGVLVFFGIVKVFNALL